MRYIGFLFFLWTLILLNSCCQMKDCYSVEDINEIQLHNFARSDVDSIVIKMYQKNSDFCTFVDSFITVVDEGQEGDENLVAFMPQKLDLNFDYKITMTSINQTYLLTDFSTKKEECNSCFPAGHDHVTVLDSYFVNGQKQNLRILQLTPKGDF